MKQNDVTRKHAVVLWKIVRCFVRDRHCTSLRAENTSTCTYVFTLTKSLVFESASTHLFAVTSYSATWRETLLNATRTVIAVTASSSALTLVVLMRRRNVDADVIRSLMCVSCGMSSPAWCSQNCMWLDAVRTVCGLMLSELRVARPCSFWIPLPIN